MDFKGSVNQGIGGSTITVGPTGKMFTSIQSAWDSLKGKLISSAVTIDVDAGTYSGAMSLTDQPYGSFITIQGDTRTAAGQVFTATGNITKSNNDCTITLTTTPPSDFTNADYITIAGATTSAGNVGRFPIVSINTGAKTVTYTNASGVAEAVLVTYAIFNPNRILTASTAATPTIFSYAQFTLTGFVITNSGTANHGLYGVTQLSYVTCKHVHIYGCIGSGCTLVNGAIVIASDGYCSFVKNGTYGVQSTRSSTMGAVGSSYALNNGSSGYAALNTGQLMAASAVAVKNGTHGFEAGAQGLIACPSATSKYNTSTGFYSAYNAYISATTTNANTSNNGASYSPSSSDTEGNVSSLITWS